MLGSLFRKRQAVYDLPTLAPVFQHADTAVTLQDTAIDRRFTTRYKKTYDFPGDLIDDHHRALRAAPRHQTGMIDIGLDGWLLPQDALKLYEMAHFCPGDILELGSYRGLSASILADATEQSGRRQNITSVDLDKRSWRESQQNLKALNIVGRERIKFVNDDAIAFVANMARKGSKVPFAFVDHSHRYEHVMPTCQKLHDVIEPGGFVLFHDYNDPRNADTLNPDYGVYQGIHEGLKPGAFDFWGAFGCTGLFRRRLA